MTHRLLRVRGASRAIASTLALSFVAASIPARAADKAECVDAYEQTQKLRKSGHLRDAHEKAEMCASSDCPSAVQGDCRQWSKELDEALPSIALTVKDKSGAEVSDAKVTIDGDAVEGALSVEEIALDPGAHKIRVVRGEASAEASVKLEARDKKHAVALVLGADDATPATTEPAAATDAKPADAPPADDATKSASSPIPASVWILGGVGVAGLVGFVGFGLAASSAKSSLDDSNCKPYCAQSDVDKVTSRAHFADLSLGVGLLSLGVATALYLTRDPSAPTPEPAAVGAIRFDVDASPRGGRAWMSVAF